MHGREERRVRPERDDYFMKIAAAVSERSNCCRDQVGAVLALEERVISTGYNGTPENMKNCDAGGCFRCANPEKFKSGEGYDRCTCVHAEQNALLAAARFGIAVQGATLYTTRKPCFTCSKELLQAKVVGIYYRDEGTSPKDHESRDEREIRHEYEMMLARFPGGTRKVGRPAPRRTRPAVKVVA